MSLGDVFTATFSVFRRRIGVFLALTGLQQLVSVVAIAVPVVLSLALLLPNLAMSTGPSDATIGLAILIVFGGFFLAAVVTGIVALYFDGMMITCANEATQGRFPTTIELRSLNKGYVGRIVGLYLLAMLAYLVGAVLVSLPLLFSLAGMIAVLNAGSSEAQSDASLAFIGGLSVTLLLMLALVAGAFVIGVKLAYVAQVCAVERLSGFSALRRAWGMTKGAFWRTFGYLLVFSLVAGAVQQAISVAVNLFAPTMSNLSSSVSSSGSAVLAMLRSSTFIMMIVAVYGIALLIQVVMVPLRIAFVTVMYGDQLRRQQLGPVDHAFAMNMPGYAQPGYGYPPAGYGYPQTGTHPGYGNQPGSGPYGQQPGSGAQTAPGSYGQQPPYDQG